MQKNTGLLVFVFLFFTHLSFSQEVDSTKNISNFSGAVSITNNGLSFIPTFSLGKPATIVNLAIGKDKLSFEPELRFSLEGKPWSFLFWWRYKLLKSDKVAINVGTHPALNFRTQAVSINGVPKDVIVTRRYLAGEISPKYYLSKDISIGIYYLYSRGIDKDAIRNTNFVTVNSNFSDLKLSDQVFMKFTPQFYYLKLDLEDGFYFSSSLTLAKRSFPLSISAVINKAIHTNITASKNLVWNTSLIYSFNKI